jgi:hypothetical protein
MGRILAAHILLLQITAANACTYDQDAQHEALMAMASSIPSPVWTPSRDGFRWSEGGHAFSVSYGGCHDLGLRVSVEWPADELPDEEELLRTAEAHAARFWSPTELALLRRAIEAREWTHESGPNGEYYVFHVPDYSVYVHAERLGGASKVSAGWSRNF